MPDQSCPCADSCGGCPLIGLSPEAAKAAREQRIRSAFERHLERPRAAFPIEWRSIPQPQGYRRRIRLRIHEDGRIGFFNEKKAADCRVLTPSLRLLLSDLVGTAQPHRDALCAFQHVELREADLDRKGSAFFVRRDQTTEVQPQTHEQLTQWLTWLHWSVAGSPMYPVPCQRLALPATWQFVPISSFLQVNAAINAMLVTDLVDSAKLRSAASFCDVYAGSGNFSLPLFANGLTGASVEIDPLATGAARLAASAQGLHVGEFTTGDASGFAAQAVSQGHRYDLVIVDPPRAGLKGVVKDVAMIARRHVAYCSCNPDTLARDLAAFLELGFELESVTAYDMFEHTNHVETVVWMRSEGVSPTG